LERKRISARSGPLDWLVERLSVTLPRHFLPLNPPIAPPPAIYAPAAESGPSPVSGEPSFFVRTYGCQMNVHDSEKLANLLHHAGHRASPDEEDADVLVINTCSIRDKAENQLYSDLGRLREWKHARPGRVLGVGGCVAQQVGDGLLKRFPQLDFVFGTHNLRMLASMVESARIGQRRSDITESSSLDRFDLPGRHPELAGHSPGRTFVTVMEGCDMFCAFCIVPATRGREISRPAASILEEVRCLADTGVREITLLGQTVNAYGRHDVRRGRASAVGTMAFAELLGALDSIGGIERIRYTSPHPLFFDDALVAAHATLGSLCPHVHLPLQSGSDRVLSAMRRRYDRETYLGIAESLRAAVPDIALTTDVIVGFPGETEADFEDTLDVVRRVGYVDSFSFMYSPRPGTSAVDLPDPVERAESIRRFDELVRIQRELTVSYHRSRVGSRTEILVEKESRRGGGQLCGHDPYHRTVNLVGIESESASTPRPGDLVPVEIVEATPHSLLGALSGSGESASRKAIGNHRVDVKPAGSSAEEGQRRPAARRDGGEALRILS
jgi:tRNA-2-methylthio-N6-dimethylallyladenosine synthase